MKSVVTRLSLLLLIGASTACGQNNGQHYLLVGTYTGGKSEGIYVFRFNSKTGEFSPVSIAKGIKNPSFLAVAPNSKFVYSVNENDGQGSVTAFTFSNGNLGTLNVRPSGGNGPCYVSVDKTGKWVAVGNYGGGSFEILPVQADGSLGEASTVMVHQGKSVNPQRQEKAHVHATVFSPDNKYLYVPDLGMDKVMTYSFDEKTGKISAANPAFAATTPGTGPRHLDFHPNGKYAYLMEELSGAVSVFSYKNGKLTPIQNITSHPAGYKGAVGSADIHVSPDGKFLYASNRGESNTIAIFSINQKNGQITPVGHQPTLGTVPRNFNFDPSGNFLLVANQNSDNIVIFKRDKKTGKLTPVDKQISVGNPVCIKWID
jgi:6-phosphogluconolactonase